MVHKIKKILLIYISISLSVSPAMAQIQEEGSGDDKFSVSQGKDDGKRAADLPPLVGTVVMLHIRCLDSTKYLTFC